MADLIVNEEISIPATELRFTFARSSGPGGQNVNKVNSKATLRWNVSQSSAIPEGVRARFVGRYANRIDQEGEFWISSETHREQGRNVRNCLEKLRALLVAVAAPPVTRKPTRPTYGSTLDRLQAKRDRSLRKARRRPPEIDHD